MKNSKQSLFKAIIETWTSLGISWNGINIDKRINYKAQWEKRDNQRKEKRFY
jgi:hypothetical protein